MSKASILLALAAAVAAKPPSNSRTYAVDYFYGTGPLTEGRMDPIISPGGPSNHVHTVMGGSAFAYTMSDDTALTAKCTNSLPKADLSNYWWPKLYFHDPNNGSFIDVDLYYAKVYYFSEPTDDETKAFPQGLRMITGNAMARTWNDKKGQLNIDAGNGTINSVQFVCGTTGADPWPEQYQGNGHIGFPDPNVGGHGVGFPDANCDGYTTPLRYDLHYPSCYNPAVNRDDYQNNMAFPSSVGATPGRQNCPAGWTHTPHVFIEVYWNTPPFAGLWTPGQGNQPFVLAQGDPTGYGLHGDFLSGWVEEDLQAIIDDCDAGDAGMNQCPNIASAGGVNDNSGQCSIPPANPDEVIHGVLPQLPGCNPLQWGPGAASVQTANCGAAVTDTNTATSAAAPTYAKASSPAAKSSASVETSSPAAKSSASVKASPTAKSSGSVEASSPAESSASVEATSLAAKSSASVEATSPAAKSSAASASASGSGSSGSSAGHVSAKPYPTTFVTATPSASSGSLPSGSSHHGHGSAKGHGHHHGHHHGTGSAPPAATGAPDSSGLPDVCYITVTDYVTEYVTATDNVPEPTGAAKRAAHEPMYAHFRRHLGKRDGGIEG